MPSSVNERGILRDRLARPAHAILRRTRDEGGECEDPVRKVTLRVARAQSKRQFGVLLRLRREAHIELCPAKILQRPAIIGIELVRSTQVAEGFRRPTAPDGNVTDQVVADMVGRIEIAQRLGNRRRLVQ